MSKPDSDTNRWHGKSAEYVLTKSFHEIRDPIIRIAGYLNVLKSADLSEEQLKHFIDEALNCAVSAKEVVDSVYQYVKEKQ
jgi:signal transduction histidine kinase